MRTIEFRGKDIETGEWIYGNVINRIGYMPSIMYPYENEGKVRYAECAVKRDTVGQFTGLHDNGGKEIYEGDLIEVDDRLFGVVEWHKDGYFFINDTIVGVRSYGGEYSPIGEMVRYFSNHGHDFSVIGNIHDNPELLKGGNQ